MATITLGGNKTHTNGELPQQGSTAPSFELIKNDLSRASMDDYRGKRVILNIFPSIDTDVCATSVKNFNERASDLNNTAVLNISRDTPFAQKRFVDENELNNVELLSDFESGTFGKDYGLLIEDGAFKGLHSRAVVVVDELGKVIYNQQVPEIGEEPNYLDALKSLL
ncbi:MAG: thiol peroxidase [Nonlabens sp.]